jgi:hypothetical protein
MVASALGGLGRYSESKAILDEILAQRPNGADVRWMRSFANLGLLNFKEGFADYEYRYLQSFAPMRSTPQTLWRGEETEVLFVHCEQGLGDQIQFVRFLQAAKERCKGKVILEVAAALTVLFENMADRVWARDSLPDRAIPTEITAHIPLMSLPHVLGVDSVDGQPYLAAPPMRFDSSDCKVGFCWKGNPEQGRDKYRSLTSEEAQRFKGLAPFGSLKVGEKPPFEMPVIARPDLGETAMVMQTLDLVVTVDTMIAHLAGAMGIECWLLTPQYGEWRWGSTGSRSPWYDSIELFRAENGDRSSQIEAVCERLRKRYKHSTSLNGSAKSAKSKSKAVLESVSKDSGQG